MVVTDRCWSFQATWLLHTRTLPALEPEDIQPKAELRRARQARAVLDGTPEGLALARRLGVRYLLVDPTCTDTRERPTRPPAVGTPLFVSQAAGGAAAAGDLIRTLRAAAGRPALALYLLALATLGFKWLSPLSSFHETAGWTDLLVALAAACLGGRLRSRPQLSEATPVPPGTGALDRRRRCCRSPSPTPRAPGARNVLLLFELAVLAVLTSEFASDRDGLRRDRRGDRGSFARDGRPGRAGAGALLRRREHVADRRLRRAVHPVGQLCARGRRLRAARRCSRASASSRRRSSRGRTRPCPPELTTATQVALSAVVLLTFSRGAIAFFMAMGIRAAYRRLDPPAARARRDRCSSRLRSRSWRRSRSAVLHLDPTQPSTLTYEVPDPGNRREAFDTGLDTLADHPLTGKGPGTYVSLNRGFPSAPTSPRSTWRPRWACPRWRRSFSSWSSMARAATATSIATWSGLIGLAHRRPRAGHRALPARLGDGRLRRRRESLQAGLASARSRYSVTVGCPASLKSRSGRSSSRGGARAAHHARAGPRDLRPCAGDGKKEHAAGVRDGPRRVGGIHRGGAGCERWWTPDHRGLLGELAWRNPTPGELLQSVGLSTRVSIDRSYSTYTWFLKEQVEAQSDDAGNCRPLYDFCFLDGQKNWSVDRLAVVLIEKLLQPGGWLLLDDLGWSARPRPPGITIGPTSAALSQP